MLGKEVQLAFMLEGAVLNVKTETSDIVAIARKTEVFKCTSLTQFAIKEGLKDLGAIISGLESSPFAMNQCKQVLEMCRDKDMEEKLPPTDSPLDKMVELLGQ